MTKLGTEEKRVFLLASASPALIEHLSKAISRHISNSQIFSATDGVEAHFKMENAPPHAVFLDRNLPKLSAIELVTKILASNKLGETSVIIISPIPDKEHFVDQVVTGQVQFLSDAKNDLFLGACLSKALNRLVDNKDFSYHLKFLAPEEILFKEGEVAHSVFIVKRGELQAFKGEGENEVVLGKINIGEFVGEMAHINSEPRSATVRALSACELIEIPTGTLDTILFSKPAWSRALTTTLSRRLKRSNDLK